MTKDEIRMVGIFVAGRIAAKEKELGVSDLSNETDNQRSFRILMATSEFIHWLYDIYPDMLPQESRDMVEAAKIDALLENDKLN